MAQRRPIPRKRRAQVVVIRVETVPAFPHVCAPCPLPHYPQTPPWPNTTPWAPYQPPYIVTSGTVTAPALEGVTVWN